MLNVYLSKMHPLFFNRAHLCTHKNIRQQTISLSKQHIFLIFSTSLSLSRDSLSLYSWWAGVHWRANMDPEVKPLLHLLLPGLTPPVLYFFVPFALSWCFISNQCESCRQVRWSVRLLSVQSCLVCIWLLIQEPAVLAVEVNIFLKIIITERNSTVKWVHFSFQVVCMEERSIRRAAAGLQTPLPAWRACVWTGWPPALKSAVFLPASTSSAYPGSAALCVLVIKTKDLTHKGYMFQIRILFCFGAWWYQMIVGLFNRLCIWGQSVRPRWQFPSSRWPLPDLHMWGTMDWKLIGNFCSDYIY